MRRVLALTLFLAPTIIGLPKLDVARADESNHSRRTRVELLFNEAADGLCVCVPFAEKVTETSSKQMILEGYRKLIDRYSGIGITRLLLNTNYQRACYPSKVWDAYWDIDNPDVNLTGWPRTMWLIHKAGVDPYAECIRLSRRQGISPWASMRMNDTHYLNEPHKPNSFWKQHPEYRTSPNAGFNFAIADVRQHHLALIKEILQRYDVDGIELDWMRGYPYFPKSSNGDDGRTLTQFMQAVRRIAEQASQKRGHRVRVAARVPAVPDVAHALGLHGDSWVREGLVDTLIVSSTWMPADRDTPLEEWRTLIGSTHFEYKLAASMGLWVRCAPGSAPVMRNNLESARGFTTAMIDRGADQIYLFNHFNPNDFLHDVQTPEGSKTRKDIFRQLVAESAHVEKALTLPRRYILTYHDTAAPGIDNRHPLPAVLNQQNASAFRIYMGSKPTTGTVTIRVGLKQNDKLWEAKLQAHFNSVECHAIADLNRPGEYVPHTGPGFHYVWSVAQVAPRVAQFEVPLSAVKRGYNRIELHRQEGATQTATWLEVFVTP